MMLWKDKDWPLWDFYHSRENCLMYALIYSKGISWSLNAKWTCEIPGFKAEFAQLPHWFRREQLQPQLWITGKQNSEWKLRFCSLAKSTSDALCLSFGSPSCSFFFLFSFFLPFPHSSCALYILFNNTNCLNYSALLFLLGKYWSKI